MLLSILTLALLTDVAPRPYPRPAPRPAECTADGDCMLSTFNGCCGSCCTPDPHAVRKDNNEAARCAVIDCAGPDCSAVKCRQGRDPSEFVPACRAGRCVALPRNQEPAQCRADTECRVVEATPPARATCHQSACGCCPVSQAVPIDAVVPLQRRPPLPPTKNGPAEKPNFGLSTGEPTGLQRPSCSPCPGPMPARAACVSGRCVLQPVIRRPPNPG